jgi:Carboxypeptidase regulatory-like domain/TonB-dependent Receptor Plug Domain
MFRARFIPLMLVFILLPGTLCAQARLTAADLQGTVRDASGGVLPGVTVTATNVATNQPHSATTDKDGRYFIGALQPGTYTIAAELSGFASQKRKDIRLLLGQLAQLDFAMSPGTQESIVVSAHAPVVDTTQTSVSTVVGQEQIDALPTNDRNFLSFSVITPGVTFDNTPQQGASATSGLTFGGQRARSNNVMVDGVDNNDPVVGAVRATFSQEAVQEFQVLTNSYSAEFGKATGGVVNIITHSGTNDFRGNVFEFFRDKSMNAKNYFEQHAPGGAAIDQDKAPFRQNQYGLTLGGPIKRDQTFFFLSAEKLATDTSNFVNIDPAAAALLNQNGFPVQLGNVPYSNSLQTYLGKVDHAFAPAHNLAFRANYASLVDENIEPFGGIVAKSRGAVQDRKDWALAASQTDTFSNDWINELRGQYAKEDQTIDSLDPNCGGSCTGNFQGGPTVEIIGVASVGRQRFTPNPRHNQRYQLKDTLSWYNGVHSVKGGFDYNYIHTSFTALPLHFGGRYIFAALPAIPALGLTQPVSATQAFALGLPAAYVKGYGQTGAPYNDNDVAAFVQDDWAVNKNFIIKAGLRYQVQSIYNIPYTVSMPGGGSYTYRIPKDKNNLGPRLSIAYDPRGDGRSNVHAAWGIFYDNSILAAAQIGDGINGQATGVRTLVLRIPGSIGAWKAPGHNIPEPTTPYPSLVISPDPGMKTPQAQQAAVGYEQAIGQTMSLSVDGLFVHGTHQLGTIDYNPIVPSLGAGRRPDDVGGVAGTSASVLQYTSFGETWYKGLTLSLNKRFSQDFQYLVSYTLSKAEDNSTDFQSAFIVQNDGRGRDPNNPTGLPIGFDPNSERGLSLQDQKHRLVMSGLYQLPAQFQLSGILTFASGRPFTALAGVDLNGDGDGGAFPSDRARTNPTDPSTSVAHNSERMKSGYSVDLRLSKRISMGGGHAFDAMLDCFNVTNHVNYIAINNIFGTGAYPTNPAPTYGQYTAAAAGRQFQLGAKFTF